MSRLLNSCLACVVCLGATACSATNTSPEPAPEIGIKKPDLITQAACDQIESGMTVEQVQHVLGRPADKEFEEHALIHDEEVGKICIPSWELIWRGEEGEIRVHFELGGLKRGRRVSHATFVDGKSKEKILKSDE
jgi:hypothetical protein